MVRTALGLGVLGELWFLLGLAGGLGRAGVASTAALVLAAGWWAGRRARPLALSRRARRAAAALALALVPSAALALYPPTEFDATLYHLPFAQAFLEAGGPVFVDTLRFPVFPVLDEMLFAALMLSGTDTAAHLASLLQALLTAALVALWGWRALGPRAGLWAASLWLGTPLVVWLAAAAYVDLGVALFAAGALYAWESSRQGGGRGRLWLAGAFAGYGAAIKYSGLFFVAVLGLLAAARALRQRRPGPVVAFALAAALAAGPFYGWIYAETGSPVFPFYSRLFDAGEYETLVERGQRPESGETLPGSLAAVARHQTERVVEGLSELAQVPWDTIFDREDHDYQAPLSPWLLVLLPSAGLMALVRPLGRRLLLWCLGFGLFWLISSRDPRLLLPALPALALALAAGLDELLARVAGGRRGRLAALVAAALLLPGPLYGVYKLAERGPVPIGAAAREAYFAERVPGYRAVSWLNRDRGGEYALYALYGPRLHYYARGKLLGDHTGPHRFAKVLPYLGAPRLLHRRLRALGADHLLITHERLRRRLPRGEPFDRLFTPVFDDGEVVLYRLAGT